MAVVFRHCPLYRETLLDKARAYPIIGQKMQDFRTFKSANPLQQYGGSDKPFVSNGFFGNTVRGLKHAHLTHDIMVVYKLSGHDPKVFDLYGIFSHDELGIGQPANLKKQKSAASRLGHQDFN